MPASMATTNTTAFVLPMPIATKAGPGQKPAMPQPTPNTNAPASRRRSIRCSLGSFIGASRRLALVMAGAIAVGAIAFAVARTRTASLLDAPMKLPSEQRIDRRLLAGALVFGVGWGIAGFCPGPALVAIGMGSTKAVVFVVAMLAGMGIFQIAEKRP